MSISANLLLENGDLLVAGMKRPYLAWFCAKTVQPLDGWDNASMIVRLRGLLPVAAIVYNHFWRPDIWMHVAAEKGSGWCTHDFIRHAFWYPFVELECGRVTGLLGARTHTHHKLMLHLGFTVEGRIREALPTGDDFIVYGMLRRECRWIKESYNEQTKRTHAA